MPATTKEQDPVVNEETVTLPALEAEEEEASTDFIRHVLLPAAVGVGVIWALVVLIINYLPGDQSKLQQAEHRLEHLQQENADLKHRLESQIGVTQSQSQKLDEMGQVQSQMETDIRAVKACVDKNLARY